MRNLSVEELSTWRQEGRTFRLVDVREDFEHEHFNIGGDLISLGELMSRKGEINREIPVVIYCEKGIRSVIAIQRLEATGFTNLFNLEGGMKAYRNLSL